VQFNKEAERLWDRFYMTWELEERTGLYAAAVKRIHVYIRKLAMTYAALEGTLPEINVEQLKAAIAVGIYSEAAYLAGASSHPAKPDPPLFRHPENLMGQRT
jgi:hypothetical protein